MRQKKKKRINNFLSTDCGLEMRCVCADEPALYIILT